MNEGKLYIIASPIGNMSDMTYRAVEVLKNEIGMVFCEDTRVTGKLLKNFDISLPLKSLHAHSTEKKISVACRIIKDGTSIAYITDSGTPSISDPGSKLVKAAAENSIRIIPLPGPSALTSILSVSGFLGRRVHFVGFLSKKPGRLKRELESLKHLSGTIVIYESPYRIKKLMKHLNSFFPGSDMIIGREMTKKFEEFIRGKVDEIYENIDNITQKGEFTLAILNEI